MSCAAPTVRLLLLRWRPAAHSLGWQLCAASRLLPAHSALRTLPACRGLHWTRALAAKDPAPAPTQPSADANVKLPMYDMPMWRQVRNLRFVFLVNVFCSTAVSLWVQGDDIYTVLVACGMMAAGFIPLAFIQLMYNSHVKSIRILGSLNKRAVARARKAERAGTSQIEFPVNRDTPLLVTRFSLTATDPQTPLFVRDLAAGPSRKYSVLWLYRSPAGLLHRFRVSKKIIQYHPDIRALDELIRKNTPQPARPTDQSGPPHA
ncbi:hypothetical protein IWQ57_000859 [Coemansia nantahalensis]|uniref:Uncharacterized protein n=1 Tax=Coemansia nantahalensis TaxID=2789366 RepID=A0ACC1K756_9FUNG|nr:hypothetical protein IWQ57_000859 [Coemansia nantahalensis]